MRALVWDGSEARMRERPPPRADDETALVRVTLAGVCNTDLEIVRGYMGYTGILGHEFVGVVEEGPEPWRGERVVGEINFACGACPLCDEGLVRHCPSRRVMGILEADGAFAEYVAVPVANLHRVPEGLPDATAVFTEPLAAAFAIVEQVKIESGIRCVVLGDGKLGLLVAQVLQLAGAHVIAVGRHRTKLDLLAARGIETALLDSWPGERTNLVVEATGSPEGLRQALAIVRPRGTLVLKSTFAEAPGLDLSPLVIDEIQLLGSRCGPFPPALAALGSGEIDVAPLVSERLPLAQADEALRRARQPGTLKVLIECA
jgi:threonine dehydrogenase-like Zn-dependent dehydrogenase